MSDDVPHPRVLDEVLRLATAVAEQILTAESSAQSMTPTRIKALIGAAQFLHDNDVPWSAAVQEALDKIREHMDAAVSGPGAGDSEG